MTYTTLLPARMGRLELRNRIVFPAMVTNYCSTRGEVTDRLVAYHQERAKGGAGLLITEATYISPDGKSFPHQLGIDDDGLLPGLRRLVESVHAAAVPCRQTDLPGRDRPAAPFALGDPFRQ